jgi:hypothetical protein
LLLLVTVDGKRGPSVLTEVLGQVVGDPLGTDEDEDLGVLRRDLLEVLDQLAALLKVGADLDDLSDVEAEGNENLLRERLSHSADAATYQTGGGEEILTLTVAGVMRRTGSTGRRSSMGRGWRVCYECMTMVSVLLQLNREGRTHWRRCRLTK